MAKVESGASVSPCNVIGNSVIEVSVPLQMTVQHLYLVRYFVVLVSIVGRLKGY